MGKLLSLESRIAEALKQHPLENRVSSIKVQLSGKLKMSMCSTRINIFKDLTAECSVKNHFEASYNNLHVKYEIEVDKRDKLLVTGKEHLELTINMAERFKIERDQALHTAERAIKECSVLQEKVKDLLQQKESEMASSIERYTFSNHFVKNT
jgi:hypothetical protein